jgi:hypothetical protein
MNKMKEMGMRRCGILGMGETVEQRLKVTKENLQQSID